nr:PQQ-binding-like beta-propeller repeat protein [uncultured Methanolobus sp.]
MVKNIVTNTVTKSVILLLLLIFTVTLSSAHDVTVSRTIEPTTVDIGESFNVSLEIVVTGTLGDENSSYAAVKDIYSSVDDVGNWVVSNVVADSPFNKIFLWNDNNHGMAEFGAGPVGLLITGTGTYHVNYTVTPSTSALGTFDIGGYYIDADYAPSGMKGTYAYTTGDSQITIEGIPEFTSTDWPQFQGNLYKNGVTSDRGPIQQPDETESWITYTYGVPGAYGIDTVSIVVDNLVYAATHGAVYAVDRNTGEIEWSSEIVTGVTAPLGAPAYGNGKIFVGAFGHIYAFDALNGTELWNDAIGTDNPDICQINTPITYDNGRIFFGEWLSYLDDGDECKYYCYDEDGNELWARSSSTGEGYYRAGAVVIKQYLVYPDDSMHITSVDKHEGTTVDEVDMAELLDIGALRKDIRASVMYDTDSGRIYTATEDGYCISIGFNSDGTFDRSDIHKFNLGVKSTTTPSLYNERLYVGTGDFSASGKLYCLNADDLTEIWSYTPNGGIQGSPVVSTAYDDGDGEVYIYFTTNILNGTVYCLKDYTDCTEPELQWTFQASSDQTEYTLPGVTIKDGRLFYGNDHGYLFGLAEWNFWDDPISDGGENMTTDELQEAIHIWLNDEPATVTGSTISTDRLQQLIHNWLEN